jgi:hypothetical protein
MKPTVSLLTALRDQIRKITVGQLYDLERDPYEQSNLFDQQPEIVAKLRERLQQLVHEDRSRP